MRKRLIPLVAAGLMAPALAFAQATPNPSDQQDMHRGATNTDGTSNAPNWQQRNMATGGGATVGTPVNTAARMPMRHHRMRHHHHMRHHHMSRGY